MKKWLLIGLRLLGMLFVAHALMLLGADEISTLEAGGVRMIRSLEQILTLYGADPAAWQTNLPMPLASAVMLVLSWPGWAVLAVTGGLIAFIARSRE